MSKKSDVIERRKQKIEDMKKEGIVPLFPNTFKISHTIGEIFTIIEETPDLTAENSPVFRVSGRMMAVNRFGKAAFIRLRDRTGQLQAYIRKDQAGEDQFALFKQMDIGDFIGLEGPVFQTRTGEWTLDVKSLSLVSKAVRPLPEKYHGLKDPEKRYRKRYVDLMMNPEVKDIFIKRSAIIRSIREFLIQRDFLEVETPMMQPIPGGAEARPFVTHHRALDMQLYLRIAPELYLKRLVVGGLERVFEINRNFRNEGVSTRHNPEFTMLEFYQAYADYEDLMNMTEDMFKAISNTVLGTTQLTYRENTVELSGKWNRIPMKQALSEIGGVPENMLDDHEALARFASEQGIALSASGERKGKILTKLFDILVEPKLIQPTFITGYPVAVSPLSRRNDIDPTITDRFELFIGGQEIANGFSELNDPADQYNRFLEQVEQRESGDDEAHLMDSDYIEALEYGMPPTAGEGVGIDRVAMLFTNSASIREVILFPHMKPA